MTHVKWHHYNAFLLDKFWFAFRWIKLANSCIQVNQQLTVVSTFVQCRIFLVRLDEFVSTEKGQTTFWAKLNYGSKGYIDFVDSSSHLNQTSCLHRLAIWLADWPAVFESKASASCLKPSFLWKIQPLGTLWIRVMRTYCLQYNWIGKLQSSTFTSLQAS